MKKLFLVTILSLSSSNSFSQWSDAGLPNISILKAVTINGAKALGISDKIGSIERDKLADLLIVKGNPLEDIKAARDIELVIKGGVAYYPKIFAKIS